MTQLTDEYKDAPAASSEAEETPQPQAAAPAAEPEVTPFVTAAIQPANENAAPHVPFSAPQTSFSAQDAYDASAEESFSIAPQPEKHEEQALYAAGTETCENVTLALRNSLEEIAAGFGQLNWKLMEFGRANAQSNMAFVQNVAGVRNVRDAVDLQTAFLRGQYDAAATQLRELQALGTEIAEKAAAPFKQQFMRQTQAFRMC